MGYDNMLRQCLSIADCLSKHLPEDVPVTAVSTAEADACILFVPSVPDGSTIDRRLPADVLLVRVDHMG